MISSNAKLEYQMGYLVIRRDDRARIHLSEIGVLIIETTAVSLTAALLNELNRRKIKVIFCDEKRNPSSELIPYYGSHDASVKVRKQIRWGETIKKQVWTAIVREKILKQAELLEIHHLSQANLLRSYAEDVADGDVTNREGHAAKVYFNALFGMEFTRDEDNSINAALNYGYSILLSVFNREIVANGYLTQLGLSHENMFNHFNLSSDLMEPFRPLVDEVVLDVNPKKFEWDEKSRVLQVLQREVRIGGRRETTDNAIRIYSKSVLDALGESEIKTIRFYQYEL